MVVHLGVRVRVRGLYVIPKVTQDYYHGTPSSDILRPIFPQLRGCQQTPHQTKYSEYFEKLSLDEIDIPNATNYCRH